jgi:hypothetical protein
MTSFRQTEANRRNARKSTGPTTEEGKQRSRCNAVRHGLTAETVIGALEDAEDYKAFEAAVIADYDATSAVERELVLRLASGGCAAPRQLKPACSRFRLSTYVGSGSPAKFTKPIETLSTHYSDGPMRGVLTTTPLRLTSQMVRNPSPAPRRNLNLL